MGPSTWSHLPGPALAKALFSSGPKPPKPPAPAPLPSTDQSQAGEAEIKKLRRQSGYEKTLITGSLTPNTGKRITLG